MQAAHFVATHGTAAQLARGMVRNASHHMTVTERTHGRGASGTAHNPVAAAAATSHACMASCGSAWEGRAKDATPRTRSRCAQLGRTGAARLPREFLLPVAAGWVGILGCGVSGNNCLVRCRAAEGWGATSSSPAGMRRTACMWRSSSHSVTARRRVTRRDECGQHGSGRRCTVLH